MVCGDSWFGSLTCCKALKALGLYSQFLVKTAYKHFPLKYLQRWAREQDALMQDDGARVPWGNWKLLKHSAPNATGGPDDVFYALGHRDRRLKTMVSNKGTTLPGEPLCVERCRLVEDEDGRLQTEWYLKKTPRVQMLQLLFDSFSAIDVHDHRRQGVFQMEKFWKTKCWWHRIFATVGIGMCMVDAYLAFKMEWHMYENDDEGSVEDFVTFAGHVAHDLIFNEFFENPADAARRRRKEQMKALQKEAEEARRDVAVWFSINLLSLYILLLVLLLLIYATDVRDSSLSLSA